MDDNPKEKDLSLFLFSFALLFVVSFCVMLNIKKTADHQHTKNLLTGASFFTAALLSMIGYALVYSVQNIEADASVIFSDERLIYPLVLEFICMLAMRKNYELNGDNIVAINFSMFLSLPLVPLIAFFGTQAFGFEETKTLNYASTSEFIVILAVITTLIGCYFIDKFKKGHFNSWFFLLLPPFLLSANLFFGVKLMQIHNPLLIYATIMLATSAPLLFVAFSQGESRLWGRGEWKKLGQLSAAWIVLIPCNAWATQLVSTEIFTLLKRISQIFAGMLMDKIYNKSNRLKLKDKAIILVLFFIGVWLYYSRSA